ncbi:MAG: TonB family protein [Geobacteraceae bacterium]|nr:TonB family protein [Geobacteraceae bacterium]
MSENSVEKNFLYLVLVSVFIHAAIFALLLNMPNEKPVHSPEPQMVDLEGIPAYVPPKVIPPPIKIPVDVPRTEAPEIPPKGDSFKERVTNSPWQSPPPSSARPDLERAAKPQLGYPSAPDIGVRERSPADALFRKRGEAKAPDTSALYPGADKMARLEESYRKKYGDSIAAGETSFFDKNDMLFGSFMSRFGKALDAVWKYPESAGKLGIEGITVVMITFNRRGVIVKRELLEGSGSKILDDEVLRAIDELGPVGSLPKGYDKDIFNLLLRCHYIISQGGMRFIR